MSQRGDAVGSSAQGDAAALLDSGAAIGRWVLDPAGSRVEFHVKHFWGAITVRGSFGVLSGEGTVSSDGGVSGHLRLDDLEPAADGVQPGA